MSFQRLCLALVVCGFAICGSAGEAKKKTLPSELPSDYRSADAKIREATEEIRIAIERFRKAGRNKEADRFAESLKDIRAGLTGEYKEPKVDDPDGEMHIIGLYEGVVPPEVEKMVRHPTGFAAVKVTYTHRPVILVLTAYEPIAWNVSLVEGAKVERVVLCGYYAQDVTGLPKDVLVEGRGELGEGARPYGYKQESLSGGFGKYLRDTYAVEPITFQSAYRYGGTPYIVGPENGAWRAAKVWQRLAPLHREATQEMREELAAELKQWKFTAMHVPASAGRFDRGETSIANFTPLGPIKATMKPVESACRHVAFDPHSKTYYALKAWPDHAVVKLDADTGKMTKLEVPELDGLGHVAFLAFDTKRKRLLVSADKLKIYDVATGKVTESGDRTRFLVGLTYAADEDVFYAAYAPYEEEGARINQIARLNAEGAVMEKVMLQQPIMAGERLGEARIFAHGGKMVIMPCSNHVSDSDEIQSPAVSYVIDTKSGKQLFSCLLQVQDE